MNVFPQAIHLFEATLRAMPPAMVPTLLRQAQTFLDTPSLAYEREIINRALQTERKEDLGRAMSLCQRPGRLFYALASHAQELQRALGVEISVKEGVEGRDEDISAQLAWWRLTAGSSAMIDRAALFAPMGDLAAVMTFLDRRGLQSYWEMHKSKGDDSWMPPPFFGFLGSTETSERLDRYNRGLTDRVGDISLGFPKEIQTVVLPKVYSDTIRKMSSLQYIIPASDILDNYFTEEWARSLPPEAVVAMGIKGLPDGRMPREQFEEVVTKAERTIPVVGIYGYMPANGWMEEQRDILEGHAARRIGWNILLTDPHTINALELAKRWAGPEAVVRQETYREPGKKGIPVIVVENKGFKPPLKITIISDGEIIKANELASIYKNLEAIHLGRCLFDRILEAVQKQERGGLFLNDELPSFYRELMKQAEEDIRSALSLEGIAEEKIVLLPEVREDFIGSWGTKDFEDLYHFIQKIFDPDVPKKEKQEEMVLLKHKIRDHYSVRNPCYGFCMAVDRAAVMDGLWLSRQDLSDAVERLKRKGLLKDRKGRALTDKEIAKVVGHSDQKEAHYFFSVIPEGLLPEALQIAEQLPTRNARAKRKMKDLPDSFRDTHLLVQRLQLTFAPEIHKQIVELSKELAYVLPGTSVADRLQYLPLLERLQGRYEAALTMMKASKRSISRDQETRLLLWKMLNRVRMLVEKIQMNERLGPNEIVFLNQAVMESLTFANLFYILPPAETKKEADHLWSRLSRLLKFADSGLFKDLFPVIEDPLVVDPELVRKLVQERESLFRELAKGLIQLTYRMNLRFHSEDRAITRKHMTDSLQNMVDTIKETEKGVSTDPAIQLFLGTLLQVLCEIQECLQDKKRKLSARERLLVHQSLIDALIHSRRFLVFPEGRAVMELQYTEKRFLKIRDFLRGDEKSPLWFFGNESGSSPPTDREDA